MLTTSYRRLPGRSASFLHRSDVWLGADHLLRVDLQGVTETYRRFYFGDIQAIIVRPTRQWAHERFVSGGLAVLFLILALVHTEVWQVFWFVMTAPVLLFFVVSLLRGPTCECFLKTAVQLDQLTSLKRMRTARRFLAVVKPAIERTQGTLVATDYQQRLQELTAPTTALPLVIASTRPKTPPAARELRHSRGRLHLALCLMLLGDAVHSGLELRFDNTALNTVGIVLFLGMMGVCITTAVRQGSTDLPAGLKRLTWIVLVFYIAMVVVGIGYGILWLIAHRGDLRVSHSASNDPVAFSITAVALLCATALGLSGLLMLRRWWQAGRPAPPELADATPLPGA